MKTATDHARRIVEATRSTAAEVLVEGLDFGTDSVNELLFFFKPECFLLDRPEDSVRVTELGFSKFAQFGADVSGAIVLSGDRLDELGIMDRHYGYINKLSRGASQLVGPDDRQAMAKQLGDESDSLEILGGHEFLTTFGDFDETSLDRFWSSKPSLKLRSGFYYQAYDHQGRSVVLINGFHPAQLRHYTNPHHRIALVLLHSDTAWSTLRNDMIGDTFPEKAPSESLRGSLLRNQRAYHLPEVSVAANYCHLSAGPVEAFFEIWNFLGRLDEVQFDLEQTRLFRLLDGEGLRPEEIRTILSNPIVEAPNVRTDLFSATEGKDTEGAVQLCLAAVQVGSQ